VMVVEYRFRGDSVVVFEEVEGEWVGDVLKTVLRRITGGNLDRPRRPRWLDRLGA
jgi:hypothetical protein